MKGSLTVVGTGIRAEDHITAEAQRAIQTADKVLYLLPDPFSKAFLSRLRPDSLDLSDKYRDAGSRRDFYREIATNVVNAAGSAAICFAVYGHPTVLADAARMAAREAELSGIRTRVMPGISAGACLAGDLNVDPVSTGMQEYEATDFVENEVSPNTGAALALWQVGIIGNRGWPPEPRPDVLRRLVEMLARIYPAEHSAVIYEAPFFSLQPPRTTEVRIADLADAKLTPASTLFMRPVAPAQLRPEGTGAET
jgi:uroporphyrin-III C-methyltransferase